MIPGGFSSRKIIGLVTKPLKPVPVNGRIEAGPGRFKN